MRKIVMAAGGTGGHILPAVAVADELQRFSSTEVVFIGVGRDTEKKILCNYKYELKIIPFKPFVGARLKGLLSLLATFPLAFYRAIRFLRSVNPDVVVGFGGFPSVLPILAAWVLRIPRIIHEQNVKIGVANKFLSIIATRVLCVENARGFYSANKVKEIGNPVRQDFCEISPWKLPEDDNPLVISVLGGSQGAVSLNTAFTSTLKELPLTRIKVIHQTGKADLERVKKIYSQFPELVVEVRDFFTDMQDVYAKSGIIVARAGAMTVAEITASGRPAIFVPLALSRGHQAENVSRAVNDGAAILIPQNEQLGENLLKNLREMLGNLHILSKMAEMAQSRRMACHANLSFVEEILCLSGRSVQNCPPCADKSGDFS